MVERRRIAHIDGPGQLRQHDNVALLNVVAGEWLRVVSHGRHVVNEKHVPGGKAHFPREESLQVGWSELVAHL